MFLLLFAWHDIRFISRTLPFCVGREALGEWYDLVVSCRIMAKYFLHRRVVPNQPDRAQKNAKHPEVDFSLLINLFRYRVSDPVCKTFNIIHRSMPKIIPQLKNLLKIQQVQLTFLRLIAMFSLLCNLDSLFRHVTAGNVKLPLFVTSASLFVR